VGTNSLTQGALEKSARHAKLHQFRYNERNRNSPYTKVAIMVALDEREQQALNIIRTLPPERQRMILYELAKNAKSDWQRSSLHAEQQLRNLASERGKDWDKMNDDERLEFVCELQHEDH
jgi:hypothetical protein